MILKYVPFLLLLCCGSVLAADGATPDTIEPAFGLQKLYLSDGSSVTLEAAGAGTSFDFPISSRRVFYAKTLGLAVPGSAEEPSGWITRYLLGYSHDLHRGLKLTGEAGLSLWSPEILGSYHENWGGGLGISFPMADQTDFLFQISAFFGGLGTRDQALQFGTVHRL
jgi:hypothetical protein